MWCVSGPIEKDPVMEGLLRQKGKANYDKGAVSCVVIAVLGLLVQQTGP